MTDWQPFPALSALIEEARRTCCLKTCEAIALRDLRPYETACMLKKGHDGACSPDSSLAKQMRQAQIVEAVMGRLES